MLFVDAGLRMMIRRLIFVLAIGPALPTVARGAGSL